MYSIKDLHYGFRRRANKIESLQNRSFFVEQIDDYLNEALTTYIIETSKLFELEQSLIDDLRQLIKYNVELVPTAQPNHAEAVLPLDYFRLVRSSSIATNPSCSGTRIMSHYAVQSDDVETLLKDPLYKPDYYWGETAYRLLQDKIIVYTNGDFTINLINIDYISKHPRLGNPEDSRNGTYSLPNGTIATQQDLILDSTNQPEKIMDIAVLNAYMDISDPNYQIKLQKIISSTNYVNK